MQEPTFSGALPSGDAGTQHAGQPGLSSGSAPMQRARNGHSAPPDLNLNQSEPPEEDPVTKDNLDILLARAQARRERVLKQQKIRQIEEEIRRIEEGDDSVTEPERTPDTGDSLSLTQSIPPGPAHISDVRDEIALQKLRAIDKFHGKSVQEHTNFVRDCGITFRMTPSLFTTEQRKVYYGISNLAGNAKEQWFTREQTYKTAEEHTWDEFVTFLLDKVIDPRNRVLDLAQKYTDARQRPNQTVADLDTYLSSIEAKLPTQSEEMRMMNLYTRLHSPTRRALSSQQSLPENRNSLVAMAQRIETNRHREKGDQNKKPESKRRNRSQNESEKPSKRARNEGPKQKDKSATTGHCYTCGKPGHWAPDCPDKPKTDPQRNQVGSVESKNTEDPRMSRSGTQSSIKSSHTRKSGPPRK